MEVTSEKLPENNLTFDRENVLLENRVRTKKHHRMDIRIYGDDWRRYSLGFADVSPRNYRRSADERNDCSTGKDRAVRFQLKVRRI